MLAPEKGRKEPPPRQKPHRISAKLRDPQNQRHTRLVELASTVRGYILHDRADGYILSVQYGLHETALTAKRGAPPPPAAAPTSTPPSPYCASCAQPRSRCAWSPPYRPGRPSGLTALDQLHADAPPPQLSRRMPLSVRRTKTRAAALRNALQVGEAWDAHDSERSFNFERHWATLISGAPQELRAQLQ